MPDIIVHYNVDILCEDLSPKDRQASAWEWARQVEAELRLLPGSPDVVVDEDWTISRDWIIPTTGKSWTPYTITRAIEKVTSRHMWEVDAEPDRDTGDHMVGGAWQRY